MLFRYIKTLFYLFPLFLVGIFFIATEIQAQSYVLTATVEISVCGNDEMEAPAEECDGDDFGGYSCVNYGYDGGSLACFNDCTLDYSACTTDTDDPPPSGGGGGGAAEVGRGGQADGEEAVPAVRA